MRGLPETLPAVLSGVLDLAAGLEIVLQALTQPEQEHLMRVVDRAEHTRLLCIAHCVEMNLRQGFNHLIYVGLGQQPVKEGSRVRQAILGDEAAICDKAVPPCSPNPILTSSCTEFKHLSAGYFTRVLHTFTHRSALCHSSQIALTQPCSTHKLFPIV